MKPMSGLQELLLRRNCCLQHSMYGSPLLNSDNHRKTGKAQHAFRMQTAAIMMHLIIYIFLCNMLLLMCDEDSKTACNETTRLLSNAILSHFFWWCHQSYDLAHNCSDLDFSHNWPQMSNWGALSQRMIVASRVCQRCHCDKHGKQLSMTFCFSLVQFSSVQFDAILNTRFSEVS